MITNAIFTGIGEGIATGTGAFIGTAIVTLLAGGYISKKSHSKIKEQDLKEIFNKESKEKIHDMLDNVGFKSSVIKSKESKVSNCKSSGINWSNVREIKVSIDGKEKVSTVGGLLNTVWEVLDENKRAVFLVRALLSDARLKISPTKSLQIIASENVVNEYLLSSGAKKSMWGFRKKVFGYNIYFLNNYGYRNAPDLIRIVRSLIEDVVKISIDPV